MDAQNKNIFTDTALCKLYIEAMQEINPQFTMPSNVIKLQDFLSTPIIKISDPNFVLSAQLTDSIKFMLDPGSPDEKKYTKELDTLEMVTEEQSNQFPLSNALNKFLLQFQKKLSADPELENLEQLFSSYSATSSDVAKGDLLLPATLSMFNVTKCTDGLNQCENQAQTSPISVPKSSQL